MGLREIKSAARTALHRGMSVPAYYIATPGAEPLPCTVRVHTKVAQLGDLKGTNFSYAETEEVVPKLVLWRAEIAAPANKAVVTISAEEAYRIGVVRPPDGLTVTVEVAALKPLEAAALPYPNG